MNISPDEAEESLKAIQSVMQKTRRSISSSGAYLFLVFTGMIWLIGFTATQFLSPQITGYIWAVTSIIGTAAAFLIGSHNEKRVRSASTSMYAKRIVMFWLFLALFCIACIVIAQPGDPKQIIMFITLFIMVGQLGMGLLFSFTTVWWVLPITILSLIGYFFLPGLFHLWMGVLVGGGMVILGLYIRFKW